jgi:cytochrome c-type biogenesis protein CcmH/NrfF
MSKKRFRTGKRNPSHKKTGQASFWKITAILAVLFCIALIAKIIMTPTPAQHPAISQTTPLTPSTGLEETNVQLVASEFECACGHCGKTALMNCSCDRPHGALEEKGFIRMKLREGHSVEQVIQLLEQEYGHRIT